MVVDELHPIARDSISAFTEHGYFRSIRLCHVVASVSPAECVAWATRLIEPAVSESNQHPIVVETLTLVKSLTATPTADALLGLDALAWQCWTAGRFDDSKPYLQRAVARLAWATIGLVCLTDRCAFASERVAITADPDDNSAIKTLVYQSASAIDMTHTRSDNGRLMVALDFSHLMERLT